MYSLSFLLIGAVHLVLLACAWRLYRRQPSWYLPLAMLNLAALAYDAIAIASGSSLGFGELLKALSVPRFYTHALFTPTLIIFAFGVARRAGAGWAQGQAAHALVCLFAVGLILLGAKDDILALSLQATTFADTLRYKNAATHGPPIPAILVIIFFLAVGLWLWIKRRSPWFFLYSLLMFVIAPNAAKMPLLGNLGEIGISFAIIFGEELAQSSEKS